MRKKGQALVELAVFGSILLFAWAQLVNWGVGQVYQQQMQQEVFRRAYDTASKSTYTDYGQSASLTLIKDLPHPDPLNKFGFMERSPYVSQANVMRTVQAYKKGYDGNDSKPKMKFVVGEQERNYALTGEEQQIDLQYDTAKLGEEELLQFYVEPFSPEGTDTHHDMRSGWATGATTGNFTYYKRLSADTIHTIAWKKKVSCGGGTSEDARTCPSAGTVCSGSLCSPGVTWTWTPIFFSQQLTKVRDGYLSHNYYVERLCYMDKDNKLQFLSEGGTLDIDNDGKEEMITTIDLTDGGSGSDFGGHRWIKIDIFHGGDDYLREIQGIKYLDYQQGTISTESKDHQGYRGEYDSSLTLTDASLHKIKTPPPPPGRALPLHHVGYASTTTVSGTQTITHKIRTNTGTEGLSNDYTVGPADTNW